MALARGPLSRIPGLEFWKLCGTGPEDGFTLRFNASVYVVLCVWRDETTARTAIRSQPVFQHYAKRSVEQSHLFLRPVSARGRWSRQAPFQVEKPQTASSGPVAALTRATLKPRILKRFWRRVPNIDRMIRADPNVLFKIGLGEVPALHQVTFSIWPDTETIAQFARRSGPHAEAIRAVREEGWFAEELYARFSVVEAQGSWQGQPLDKRLGLV